MSEELFVPSEWAIRKAKATSDLFWETAKKQDAVDDLGDITVTREGFESFMVTVFEAVNVVFKEGVKP